VQVHGGTACHPGEANANFRKADVYERDLDAGYHEKGACVGDPNDDKDCLVVELFGGFGGIPGKLMRRPINSRRFARTSTTHVAKPRGVTRNVVSGNTESDRVPLRDTAVDAAVGERCSRSACDIGIAGGASATSPRVHCGCNYTRAGWPRQNGKTRTRDCLGRKLSSLALRAFALYKPVVLVSRDGELP